MSDSIFTGLTPVNLDQANSSAITVGTTFRPAVDGTITHIRWYAPATPSSVAPIGRLWRFISDDAGTELATTLGLTSPVGGGWVQAALDVPVAVTANQTYVVGVRAVRYAATNDFFATSDHVSGNLVAPANAALLRNGRFFDNDIAAGAPSYPTQQFRATAYFADVVFEPVPPAAVTVADTAGLARVVGPTAAVVLTDAPPVTVDDTPAPVRVIAPTATAAILGPPPGAPYLVADTAGLVRLLGPPAGVVLGPAPTTTPDRAIMPMLEQLLGLYRAEAAKVEHPPKYASIRPGITFVAGSSMNGNGEVIADEVYEGSIWLRVVNAYPTTSFPAQETAFHNEDTLSLAVVVELGIVRAIPYQGDANEIPTAGQHIEATRMIMADVAAMRRTYRRLREQDVDAIMGQYQPIPAEANAGGGTMHITVRAPFCDQ